MDALVQESLEPTLGAVPAARRLVDEVAGLSSPMMDDARLVVTELVANAVRHGGAAADINIALRWTDPILRIEVRSEGPFITPRTEPPPPDRGRGLMLVQALASRWGVDAGSDVVVWAELGDQPVSTAHPAR